MPITKADVQKIAELARLELSAEETESFTAQLGSILSHIDKLNDLDTKGVSAGPEVHDQSLAQQTWREDRVTACLGSEAAVENAPDAERGLFRVPRVIGG